jgi:two-component system OmpR family sensor kinase
MGDGAVRVVDAQGTPLPNSRTLPDLGPPTPPHETKRVGHYEVASQVILTNAFGGPFYVQYARSTASLDRTIGRLWLFLGGGVLGGTLLAALAGLAVARRAMRPIADLTATAHEIATTRDPSKRIPKPQTDDEVAELGRTLDEMLRELDAARAEREQMIQAQREFVADASHELRTPLTSILANLELLHEGLENGARDADEEAEIVGGALRSSRRMRRLVSDLLLLARADAGRVGVRRRCDLAEVAASAYDEVRAFASDHELALDASAPVVVEGNPDELHRLVLNLLENGVRHTPPGTEIRATLDRRDGEAVLAVTDDGPGLPGALGDQAFSRFVRGGGPADLAADSGTGLGLAIVKAVAESHEGTVEAGPAADGGARFEIRLPLAAQPAPEPAPSAGFRDR